MKPSRYGPCGLYCGACGAPDCDGCRSDRTDDLVKTCRFKRCAAEKQVDFCCFCDEFPCRPLDGFMIDEWPHHWTMKPNLENIRKNGLDKWLGRQKEEWSCPGCGAEIIWYQKTCGCGRPLDGWDLPLSYRKK
jgi:hypothetical protein